MDSRRQTINNETASESCSLAGIRQSLVLDCRRWLTPAAAVLRWHDGHYRAVRPETEPASQRRHPRGNVESPRWRGVDVGILNTSPLRTRPYERGCQCNYFSSPSVEGGAR